MAVGESVSNVDLWDTGQPPKGHIALPSMGALLGGHYSTPLTRGTKMRITETAPKFKESSTLGDSNKGFSSEAPQIGAAGRSPVGSGCGERSALGDSEKGICQRLRKRGQLREALLSRRAPYEGFQQELYGGLR